MEDEIWDGVPLQRKVNGIKEFDEAIKVIELPQVGELEDIQLVEDLEVESKVTRQKDDEVEDLHADKIAAEPDTDKLAENQDQKCAKEQYLSPGPSVLEAFQSNSASIPVDNLGRKHAYDTIADCNKADPCESEGIESARLDQLDKQEKQRFYEFAQHIVPTNLQNAFTAGSRIVQRRNLPPKPVNYQ